MAGSYRHITKSDGSFNGINLLDNLGDAYEALEECYAMIKFLTGGNKEKIYKAWLKGMKMNARENTYEDFWDDGDDEEIP
jgi:hypothetical protein